MDDQTPLPRSGPSKTPHTPNSPAAPPPNASTADTTQHPAPSAFSTNPGAPSSHPRRAKLLKAFLLVVLAIGLTIFGFATYFVISVNHYCSQKTATANRQASEQAAALRKIKLLGSKPQISTATNTDCVDGDGTGSAFAAYHPPALNLADANEAVAKALHATGSPITYSGGSDAGLLWSRNDDNTIIRSLQATFKGSGVRYGVLFVLANRYDCPGVCDSSDSIVQNYNLQNIPIREIDIQIY